MIIPIIGGPTAVGKTSLSVKLAKAINGEIISADSMQIYKFMDIGTAKVTEEESEGILHYLIDIREPQEKYSVAEFSNDARKIIKDIMSRGKTPIIVGGTGLYLNSLLYGINFDENIDMEYRRSEEKKIEKYPEYLEELYEKLKKIDPESAEKLSPIDSRRIIRALEMHHVTGKTKSQIELENRENNEFKFKLFVLSSERNILYERINKRVDIMLDQGLIDEVKNIKNNFSKTSGQAIGYKEVLMYLNNEIDYEEMSELIKQRSRNYAKRQFTWFRKNNAIWLDAENQEKAIDTILKEIK